jgi:hypothetical protein
MSLINDALKRASQTQKERAANAPSVADSTGGGAPMQPVETARTAKFPWFIPLIILVVLVAVGSFAWRSWKSRGTPDEAGLASAQPTSTGAAPNEPAKPRIQISTNIVTRNPPASAVPAAAPATPTPSLTTTVASAKPPVQPTPTSSTASANIITAPSRTAPVATAPPATAVSSQTVPAEDPVPAEFPSLQLQGIFFRLQNPSALINGRNLYVGDTISGARVSKIERLAVTVQFRGETHILKLH